MKDLILNVYSNKWIGEEKFDTIETTDHSLIPALNKQHKIMLAHSSFNREPGSLEA